jgi:signal transduction histidine kinase
MPHPGRVLPGLDPVRAPPVAALVAVAGAGVLAAVGVIVLAATSDHLVRPGLQAFLVVWVTVLYVASGLLAWWRRPASRLGPLMQATGLTMAVTSLQWSDNRLLLSAGHLLDLLPAALFLHVFLAYPLGRLRTGAERMVLLACYAAATFLQLVKAILGVNPASLVAVTVNPRAANSVEHLQLATISVLLLVGVGLLAIRRHAPGLPARRAVNWTVDSFAIALVMLAVLLVAGIRAWPSFEVIKHVTFVTLGLAPVAFLIGLLDAKLARGDVGRLLIELRAGPGQSLQGPLSRALHDPALTLAYWLPQPRIWADEQGNPVDLPGPDDARATKLIRRGQNPLALVIFDRSLQEERELLDSVVATAGIALENGQLQAELRARLQELAGSRTRVLEASRTERQRLERNLHDGAQQRLVALTLELGLIREQLTDPDARDSVDRLQAEVAASLDELRDVARGIYPAVLAGHGLAVALESLAARASLSVELAVSLADRPPEAIEVAAYDVAREGLLAVSSDPAATAARIQVGRIRGDLVVEVTDQGTGPVGAPFDQGLLGLADRVEAVGGRLRAWSDPDRRWHLQARIPCI